VSTYSIFILRVEFHIARVQAKSFRRFPHHTKGWAGLMNYEERQQRDLLNYQYTTPYRGGALSELYARKSVM